MTRQKRLTWGGRVILTVPHAAARYGLSVEAARKAISRAEDAGKIRRIDDPPPIDERTPTYYQTELDKVMRKRPGTGANLRGHR